MYLPTENSQIFISTICLKHTADLEHGPHFDHRQRDACDSNELERIIDREGENNRVDPCEGRVANQYNMIFMLLIISPPYIYVLYSLN